jgi:pimeloyl-[acyl-carrier protein] methyl ester esterase
MTRQIVLVAGWGQTVSACKPLLDSLSSLAPVHVVLPAPSLAQLTVHLNALLVTASRTGISTLVVGWSLGGLLALRWLDQLPHPLPTALSLCLLTCNPKFVAEADWPGVSPQVFNEFSERLSAAPAATLARFNALQTRGGVGASSDLKFLKPWGSGNTSHSPTRSPSELAGYAANDPERTTSIVSSDALQETLGWLSALDERAALARLDCPVLCLFGDQDALIPPLSGHLPGVDVKTIRGMAHFPGHYAAPLVAEQIRGWWRT